MISGHESEFCIDLCSQKDFLNDLRGSIVDNYEYEKDGLLFSFRNGKGIVDLVRPVREGAYDRSLTRIPNLVLHHRRQRRQIDLRAALRGQCALNLDRQRQRACRPPAAVTSTNGLLTARELAGIDSLALRFGHATDFKPLHRSRPDALTRADHLLAKRLWFRVFGWTLAGDAPHVAQGVLIAAAPVWGAGVLRGSEERAARKQALIQEALTADRSKSRIAAGERASPMSQTSPVGRNTAR